MKLIPKTPIFCGYQSHYYYACKKLGLNPHNEARWIRTLENVLGMSRGIEILEYGGGWSIETIFEWHNIKMRGYKFKLIPTLEEHPEWYHQELEYEEARKTCMDRIKDDPEPHE